MIRGESSTHDQDDRPPAALCSFSDDARRLRQVDIHASERFVTEWLET